MDRHFIRSSAAVGAANIVARALGIVFSFAVAKLYTPSDFGEVRYLMALASVLVIPTTALPRTLSRFVAKYRATGQDEADTYFSNSLMLLAGSLAPVVATALVLQGLNIGFLALCIGLSLFGIYFDVLRSVERFYALAFFYIVSNVVQLVIVIAAGIVHRSSVTLVLLAFGLSCVFPLLYIECTNRSPLHFRARSLSRPILRELTIFSLPVLLAHAAYTAWFSVDLLLVEHFLGLTAAANYGLAKTLTMVFAFVPYAMTTVVLPRFVHAQIRNGPAYLRAALLASAMTSAGLLVLLTVSGSTLLHIMFHQKYATAVLALTPLSIGMALYSVYLVLETWVISAGRPLLHALSMTLTMIVTLGSDVVLIPTYGQVGAGAGFILGAATGLIVLGYYAWITYPTGGVSARRRSTSLPQKLQG